MQQMRRRSGHAQVRPRTSQPYRPRCQIVSDGDYGNSSVCYFVGDGTHRAKTRLFAAAGVNAVSTVFQSCRMASPPDLP